MTNCSLADLQKTLTPHVPLGKTRLETLCLLLLGMISARTVNLTHIAAERSAPARVASTYRRLQRFFQQVLLPEDWCVGIVLGLIVACSEPKRGKRILRYYSWRWFIECMFADCKTKGFNLEDTRLLVPIPARLQPRLQSHRNGLFKAQGASPAHWGKDIQSTHRCHPRNL